MNQPEAGILGASVATDPGEVGSTRFDAFVSYSHADRPVAAGVQKGLQRIARRMGRLNALRVFRDDTDLIATPDLFGRLTDAMDGSRYLVVVLSPHAAASEWVNKEVTHWLERNGPDRMLMVLADGALDWDEANGCLDPSRSDAAVPVLTQPGVLPLEPLWIDVSGDAPWDLRSPAFRDKVTDLAAPIHGKPKYELASDDVREQKRFRRWRRAAVSALVVLTVLAVLAAVIAVGQRQEAGRQRQSAIAAQSKAEAAQKAAETSQKVAEAEKVKAEAQRNEAVAQTLASASADTAATNPAVAIALAAESASATPQPTRQALGALIDARKAYSEQAAHQVGRPWLGHLGTVNDVDFSPDGLLVASAGSDGSVRIWDAKTGEQVAILAAADPGTVNSSGRAGVVSLEFSSNGHFLVAVDDKGVTRTWDVPSWASAGALLHIDQQGEQSIAFRPHTNDLAFILPGSTGGVAMVDAASGALDTPDLKCTNAALTFSLDGRFLACSTDSGVNVFDVGSGELRKTQPAGATGGTDPLAISPDGNTVAALASSVSVQLWNVETGKPLGGALHGSIGIITSIAFNPGGRILATAGMKGLIQLWDVTDGAPLGAPIHGSHDTIDAIAFNRDGDRLVSAGQDGTVRLWDISTVKPVTRILDGPSAITAVEFDTTGATILSTTSDGAVQRRDVATGEQNAPVVSIATINPPGGSRGLVGGACLVNRDGQEVCSDQGTEVGPGVVHMTSTVFSPDADRIASAGDDGTVRMWDALTGRLMSQDEGSPGEYVGSLAFRTQGDLLASGGNHGVELWDGASGAFLRGPLGGWTATANGVAFSPNGSLLAAGGDDGGVRIWRADQGMSPGPRITDLPRPVNSVAFSADGSLLAAGSDDGTVRLWNTSTGAPVGEPMSGHLGPVYGVAFSPVGSLLASSGEDGTVRFWDPASSLEVGGPLQAEPSAAVSMKFSPDAQHLVTVGADGKAQVFDAVWDMRQACDLAAPFVSREQLTPYLPADWSIKGCALGN